MYEKSSEYIQNTRTMLNMTQEEFAQALKVSSQTISTWETGRRVPNQAVFEWCKAVRVAAKQFENQEDDNWKNILITMGLGALLGLLIGLLLGQD